MQSIKFEMVGTTPLMLNNPQTANPLNFYSKKIKEITSKRKKTDEDLEILLHLKFLGALYINKKGEYIIPSNVIKTSFIYGAKENKLGTKFKESVFINDDSVLEFEHSNCTPDELYNDYGDTYVDIREVGIKGSKVTTARPIIPEWSLKSEIFFDETQLNEGEVWNAMVNAGLRHGIGTYRLCYGRFKVNEIKENIVLRKDKKK